MNFKRRLIFEPAIFLKTNNRFLFIKRDKEREMAIFKGAGVAIATPFYENGSVNYDEFGNLIEAQIKGGTDAIIVCGTTGESATMSEDEHLEVVRYCIDKVAKRVPVIAGAGSNATQTAVMLSKKAQEFGADAVLSVTPYYNKATQDGLVAHFTAIAASIDIPIIMYNVPSRTGCNILPETAVKLCRDVDNIVAIKDATGNIGQTAVMMQLAEGCVDVYSGNDDIVVPMMSLGALGVISVLSNVAPKLTHDMCAECLDGNFAKGLELQLKALPLIKALFSEVNPIPVKKALNLMGVQAGPLRLPLTELTLEHAKVLEAEMKKLELI